MTGYPPILPFQISPPAGGIGVEGAEAVVTPMALTPLGEDVRKRMDFQVRSRSPNSEARRAIRMMYYRDYYELSQEDDEGLFIASYLEEAIPDDPVLQVKMAHAMQAQEVETWRCFTCNQPGHLQRDHWKYEEKNRNGPLQPKGPPLNKSAQERVKSKPSPSGQGMSQTNPPK